MLNRRRETTHPSHPEEETLRLLAKDGTADPAVREHVTRCVECTARIAELRRIRHLVQEVALREEAPRRDLARTALARLHVHRRMNSQLNEVLAGLAAFLQSLAALFARTDHAPTGAEQGAPERPDQALHRDEEERHE